MAEQFPPQSLRPILAEVAQLLTERKETVSIAETAAGGIISAALVSVPGASAFFSGGLTIYTLESRIAFAGWDHSFIVNYRGPTPALVSGLAENVRQKLGSTYCICESGMSGAPKGSEANRQSGYVALAVATPDGTQTRELNTGLGDNREANMVAFSVAALVLLRDVLKGRGKL